VKFAYRLSLYVFCIISLFITIKILITWYLAMCMCQDMEKHKIVSSRDFYIIYFNIIYNYIRDNFSTSNIIFVLIYFISILGVSIPVRRIARRSPRV
jgi:hypothetical protein